MAIGASLALALSTWALYRLVNARTFQLFGDIVASVPCTAPVVALTLDDGPTPDGTERLLELLARHGVRVTFFVTGAALERFPDAGRRIAAAGHQLGNHGYSHSRMLLKSPSFIRDEVESTDARIRAAGFGGEILFRPPYGKKLLGLPWFLRSTGRTTVIIQGLHQRGYRMATLNEMRGGACAG